MSYTHSRPPQDECNDFGDALNFSSCWYLPVCNTVTGPSLTFSHEPKRAMSPVLGKKHATFFIHRAPKKMKLNWWFFWMLPYRYWKRRPQSQSLPCFQVTYSIRNLIPSHLSSTSWNTLSYHSRNATVHTCMFPGFRSLSTLTLLFSFPDAFLPWPASVSKSLITMQYSSYVKEQGRVGVGGGGRMEQAKAHRSTRVMMAVHTCLGQQSSCLQETSLTCCSNVWFTNTSGYESEKTWFLIVASIFRLSHPGISVHPSSIRLVQTKQRNVKQNQSHLSLPCLPSMSYLYQQSTIYNVCSARRKIDSFENICLFDQISC